MLLGLTSSALFHHGNGFETGPAFAFVLFASLVGAIIGASLMMTQKYRTQGRVVVSFFIGVCLGLIALPLIWPYPSGVVFLPIQ